MTNQTKTAVQTENEITFQRLIKELCGGDTTHSSNSTLKTIFTVALFDSPLGQLVAVSNATSLLSLQCLDNSKIARKLKQLMASQKGNHCLEMGRNKIIDQLDTELTNYFNGNLSGNQFKTPVQMIGTAFQATVWKQLRQVSYGKRVPYKSIATAIGKPNAVRAVANAIGSNPLLIIVPCHRIVASNGQLCGFSCGLHRKKVLLALEGGTTIMKQSARVCWTQNLFIVFCTNVTESKLKN